LAGRGGHGGSVVGFGRERGVNPSPVQTSNSEPSFPLSLVSHVKPYHAIFEPWYTKGNVRKRTELKHNINRRGVNPTL